ncbi:metallophosphoesterase [Candidatus Bipolaricaulota bacterium]|nr:metallophosphoesterase [Candidatus Bipolaricaulota bacterium]
MGSVGWPAFAKELVLRSRFAVVSDIHGNARALDAVVVDLKRRGVSDVINLGDSLYGPFDPQPVACRLMKWNWATVSGNEDAILVEAASKDVPSRTARFTADQLRSEQIAWLKALPVRRDLAGWSAFHARPSEPSGYLVTRIRDDGTVRPATIAEIAAELIDGLRPIILCGHDHLPRMVALPGGRMLINPGSVGCPAYSDDVPVDHVVENGTPHARYAIVEVGPEGVGVEFVAVPYDWSAAAEEAARNGFADWAHWVATGRVGPSLGRSLKDSARR